MDLSKIIKKDTNSMIELKIYVKAKKKKIYWIYVSQGHGSDEA